jgi:biotin synthase
MSITRHNWTKEEIIAIYNKPMMDLLYEAASIHREHHDPNVVQVSTLLSIKTGGCPEDCGYCPQAARYHTSVEGNDLMSVSQVKAQALRAKSSGSSRVCMGAAWRNVKTALNLTKYGDGSYHQQTGDGSVLHSWYDH